MDHCKTLAELAEHRQQMYDEACLKFLNARNRPGLTFEQRRTVFQAMQDYLKMIDDSYKERLRILEIQ